MTKYVEILIRLASRRSHIYRSKVHLLIAQIRVDFDLEQNITLCFLKLT